MEEKTYTVIELAESAGVARTTINDWLSKYSAYIDFKTVGRRRVYTASAVTVIKEIADLRNKGLGAGEIETELAKNHSVRPEIAESVKETPKQEQQTELSIEKEADANSGEFALIAKQQSEELGRIFAESFRDMADRMQTLEGKANRAERKLYIGYTFVFILLFLLCAGAAMLYWGVLKQTEHSYRVEAKTQETGSALRSLGGETEKNGSAIRELDAKTVKLSGSSAELKKSIEDLKSGLTEQKAEFNKALSEMKNAKESEIAVLKEKFADEKKKLLADQERLAREKSEAQRHYESLKLSIEKKSVPVNDKSEISVQTAKPVIPEQTVKQAPAQTVKQETEAGKPEDSGKGK